MEQYWGLRKGSKFRHLWGQMPRQPEFALSVCNYQEWVGQIEANLFERECPRCAKGADKDGA